MLFLGRSATIFRMTNNAPDPLDDDRRDVQLMLALKEQDALALEELMTRNQGKVASILYHFLGSGCLAEDLTQEVFMHVYRARTTYEPTARFSTWLFKIVYNVALNALRTERRHPEKSFSAARGTDRSGEYPSFEESILEKSGLIPTRPVEKEELQKIVRAAVDALPKRQSMAIFLHRFEGMSYQEIAEVMNLSASAVKSLLCRARLSLRERLAPYFEEGDNPL